MVEAHAVIIIAEVGVAYTTTGNFNYHFPGTRLNRFKLTSQHGLTHGGHGPTKR
jgi:hypothetical protein